MSKDYNKWMKGFMDSWMNLEGKKTVEWFASDVKYYESPAGEPCADLKEVVALWAVVPQNQRDISYSYEIVCSNSEVCIYNWRMKRVLITSEKECYQSIDGIFEVSLNEVGKCTFFKQWRHTLNLTV